MRRQSRLFDQRIAEHRIVEGHGDLRPEHVLLGPRSAIIDCVEFDRALRILDPVEELACLAVECERMNAPDFVAATFLQEYRRLTGDELPSHLVSFHMSQRACLRAKLAWWHLHEPAPKTVDHWRSLALRYLRLAESHAERLL